MHDLASGLGLRPMFSLDFRAAPIGLLFFGLGALSGCDKETNAPHRVPVPSGAHSERLAGADALAPAELEALRAEVRKALRSELRPEVQAELRRELMDGVRADLQAARQPEPTDARDPDAQAAPAQPADADAQTAGRDSDKVDPWSQPGSKIWPSAGGLKLVELVVGTALEDKLPTDVRTHYPVAPEILYCYSVFENPEPDVTVTHVWRRGSRLVSRVELEVGRSPKWRTWSKQRTQPQWTGLWSCEVLDHNGVQLGLTVFQIGG